MNLLGDRIRQRRKELGWSLRELGKQANLTISFLSDLENGKRGIGADNLMAISRAIGMPLDQLMNNAHEPYKPNQPVRMVLPQSLLQFGMDANAPFRHLACMYWCQRTIMDHRINSGKEDLEKVDWKRFYAAIKEFLE